MTGARVATVDLFVFDGVEDLAASLLPGIDADGGRVDGETASPWSSAAAVHEAVDPRGDRPLLLELSGAPPASLAGARRVRVRLEGGGRRAIAERGTELLFTIEASTRVERLLDAVRPTRRAEAPDPLPGGHLLAWCGDGGSFARLVRDCFALGADRLRWAPLGARGAGAVLVRIDAPPWYLVERWTRESDALPIFAAAAPNVYVRLGWSHPLAARLRVAGGEVALFDEDGSLQRVPGPDWRDVYDAVAVSPEDLSAVRWSPAEPAPRFTVKLRLASAPDRVEPELWLLEEHDLPAVERLLAMVPEPDLKHLGVAFFAPAPPDGGTRPVAALREVITGRGRGWIDFTRRGFRSHGGLPGLFLPIDRALEPPLRRDRIAEAFSLSPGELVIVEPAADGVRALRLPESSFRPLTTYVDYIVTTQSPTLPPLIASTIFDPGPIAGLAERPLSSPSPSVPSPTPNPTTETDRIGSAPVTGTDRIGSESATVTDTDRIRTDPDRTDPGRPDPVPPDPSRPEPAPAPSPESLLESRISLSPPGSPTDWLSLADLRALRGDVDGAVDGYENARWLDRSLDADARRRSIELLEAATARAPRPDPSSGGDLRSLRLRALRLEEGAPIDPAELASLHAAARAAGRAERLRKKSRWLVWSAVLARSGDEIELERQREELLADLNQHGLKPLDRAEFVRARLAERTAHGSGTTEGGDLRRTMDALTGRISALDDVRVRFSGLALLARRWAEIDDVDRARRLSAEAIAGVGQGRSASAARVLAAAGAALLRLRDPVADAPIRRAFEAVTGLANDDERARTLAAILDLIAASDVPADATVLADALASIEAADPRRGALSLARCAPALQRIGAAPRAREMALAIASSPAVQADAHYFGAAMAALSAFVGPRELPRETTERLLAAVRPHLRDLRDTDARLVEGAVAIGGEAFALQLAERMRAADPRFPELLAWAAAIRGLAAARAADAGMEDLALAVDRAWALQSDDDRRRAVRRLTSIVPQFGRVGPGLALVQQIVDRAGRPGIGPYFRSEVLTACVDAAARLGDRAAAIAVMGTVVDLVETTSLASTGDVTFLFEVLGLCVDHAVAHGGGEEAKAILRRVEALASGAAGDSASRYWTPFYRYQALAKCARGWIRVGGEEAGLESLERVLEATGKTPGRDRYDLLREIVHSLSEVGGPRRLHLVDRVLDLFLAERSLSVGDSGSELLGLVLDEVVSPASRVRAEYARYLGAEERVLRERIANEKVV